MAYESTPKPIYIRLDEALLARIDQFAERMNAQQPGLKLNRSDAIRVLIHKGLEATEGE